MDFLTMVVLIYALIVHIITCCSLGNTAKEKGYESGGFGFGCFLFGIPFMIYVASLPDLKVRKALGIGEDVPRVQSGGVSNNPTAKVNEMHPEYGDWKCAFCGRVNFLDNSCACGKTKAESMQKASGNYTPPAGYWACPSCKAINADYVGTCSCGATKPRK